MPVQEIGIQKTEQALLTFLSAALLGAPYDLPQFTALPALNVRSGKQENLPNTGVIFKLPPTLCNNFLDKLIIFHI